MISLFSQISEVPASTPALVAQNEAGDDDDDEPPLNENDDDELDDVDQGEDQNTQHLVLAQFDKVTTSIFHTLTDVQGNNTMLYLIDGCWKKKSYFLELIVVLQQIGDANQEQVEMHIKGWDHAYKQ